MKLLRKHMILALYAFLFPIAGIASGLEVDEYPFDHIPAHQPIWEMLFTFNNKHISIIKDAPARLYHNNELIAEGKLSIDNYTSKSDKKISSWIMASFDHEILIPKGESGTLIIDKDVVSLMDNPNITNDEIRYTFEVPANIGPCRFDYGPVIEMAKGFQFWWSIETDPVGEPEVHIYRKDKKMMAFPLYVTWDWNLGQAYVDFGKEIVFQKWVEYSVRIPEGSISSTYRKDITNDEIIATFTGGTAIPQSPPEHFAHNRESDSGETVGRIDFMYADPFVLTPDPAVRLYENGEIIMEVEPTVSKGDDGVWVMSADFGQTRMDPAKGYSVMVPEATVASTKYDLFVNQEAVVDLTEMSGISDAVAAEPTLHADGLTLTIDGLNLGTRVGIVTADGRTVATAAAAAESMSLTLPGPGVYIVSINGRTHKLAVR